MSTEQQHQALDYFNAYAKDWKEKAIGAKEDQVNVIKQRNDYVLDVIQHRTQTQRTLDVGCGTGDLVCHLADIGIEATGIDFAEEMIDLARAEAQKRGLSKAQFHCSSIFDFDVSPKRYDFISANGFIEYISLEELDRFFDLVKQMLTPDGSFVFGSRNRLFNLFSLNRFTFNEIQKGSVDALLREAIAWASNPTLDSLLSLETPPLQDADWKHANTGINVSTRYQFTPVQLMKWLDKKGFKTVHIAPIHIHGIPPSFQKEHPDVHVNIANLLQSFANDHPSLMVHASSFMVYAILHPVLKDRN